VTTAGAAKGKTMSEYTPTTKDVQSAEVFFCLDGEHSWSRSHEPHAPIWVISCVICGRHNFTEMLAEHDAEQMFSLADALSTAFSPQGSRGSEFEIGFCAALDWIRAEATAAREATSPKGVDDE
jgi:hypothetical protein